MECYFPSAQKLSGHMKTPDSSKSCFQEKEIYRWSVYGKKRFRMADLFPDCYPHWWISFDEVLSREKCTSHVTRKCEVHKQHCWSIFRRHTRHKNVAGSCVRAGEQVLRTMRLNEKDEEIEEGSRLCIEEFDDRTVVKIWLDCDKKKAGWQGTSQAWER